MRLCRFNGDCLGLVEGDRVYDVSEVLDLLPKSTWPHSPGDTLIANLDQIKEAVKSARVNAASQPLDAVMLNSLVAAPSKVIAAPANYPLHVQIDGKDPALSQGLLGHDLDAVERPVDRLGLFLKSSTSVVGPGEGITLHWPGRRNDHEVELVAVIGRTGKNIPASSALDYVAGYMVGLDMTVRGTEDRSFRKSADSYTVLGPWLTTADEVSDPQNLDLLLEVNGQRRQHTSTSAMTVGLRELIEIASRVYTLLPGDIVMTGTPEGVSEVQPGDRLRAVCEAVGEMVVDVHGA